MGKYKELLSGLNIPFWYRLERNEESCDDTYRWYFKLGHYHHERPNSEPDPENSKFIGYGRMQLDLDIFAETEEECAKKAYLTLINFRESLMKIDH